MTNKIYNIINIILASLELLLFTMVYLFYDQKVLIGVISRFNLSVMIIFNAIYLLATNQKSFLITKGKEKSRKKLGIILLIVGTAAFITVLMGYGINGYPRLWK